MGTWGSGNFEQDGALDFMWREVQVPLLRKIEALIDDPVIAEADEPDSGPIMMAVEILALLAEHVNAATPKPEEVTLWKETFIKAWDRTASDVYLKQDDVIARRSDIAATFDRLKRLADKFHNRDE